MPSLSHLQRRQIATQSVDTLEPEQIANRNTYFRGYFDEGGRMVGLQKVVYGDMEFQHRYHYDEHRNLRQAEITDAEGEVTVLHFDATGKRQIE